MPEQSYSTSATLAPDAPATVMVDGRADIFSAGLPAPDARRGGQPNARLVLTPGGTTISFSNVKGLVGCQGTASAPADGGTCAGGVTDLQSANGISGIVHHQRTQFLAGVFLTDAPSTQAPQRLDFSDQALGTEFAELAPEIGQTFFIGDGVTSAGGTQRFVIPPGATRLYLGFADGWAFKGQPGHYGDNAGGLRATVHLHP